MFFTVDYFYIIYFLKAAGGIKRRREGESGELKLNYRRGEWQCRMSYDPPNTKIRTMENYKGKLSWYCKKKKFRRKYNNKREYKIWGKCVK